jgi:2-methylisocitrate lyase-like PEP mutase family enzyme
VKKGQTFHSLHERDSAFIIPNPWMSVLRAFWSDWALKHWLQPARSCVFRGRPDGSVDLEETIAHVAALASATRLVAGTD